MLGGLAQLARALDLHSRGHRFDSDILHEKEIHNVELKFKGWIEIKRREGGEVYPDRQRSVGNSDILDIYFKTRE